jgi:pimeloyl-ACP methyl ester carboxylesterase
MILEFLIKFLLFSLEPQSTVAASKEVITGSQIIRSLDQSYALSRSAPCELKSPSNPQSVCPDWEMKFAENQRQLAGYRQAIEQELKLKNSGTLPNCDYAQQLSANQGSKQLLSNLKIRAGEVDLSKIDGLALLANKLGSFKYKVIPPIVSPKKNQPLKTVIMFAGGPGTVLSERSQLLPLRDYQVIVADYVGMGENRIANIRAGRDDQNMNLDVYSKLIEEIVKQEKNAHGLGEYVLWGHSFGSVAATIVGSHLSSKPTLDQKYRPKGVLIGGVFGFTQAAPSPSLKIQSHPNAGIQWAPRVTGDKVCVLPEGSNCFDDKVFSLLSPDETFKARKAISSIYSGYQQNNPTALQSFFRDAFHWEAAQNPQSAAQFLKKSLLTSNNSGLYCWYKMNFSQIPWLNRETSASLMASIASLLCVTQSEAPECRCFSTKTPYDTRYQIRQPTKIIYVNGESDTQTPIEGALRHFRLESNPNKSFLKVCHAGHQIYGKPGTPGIVDLSELLDATFSSDLQAIHNVQNFCQAAQH